MQPIKKGPRIVNDEFGWRVLFGFVVISTVFMVATAYAVATVYAFALNPSFTSSESKPNQAHAEQRHSPRTGNRHAISRER